MNTYRHRTRLGMIEHDGHRLTRKERVKLGLPERPGRGLAPAPAFPGNPGAYVWFALVTTPQGEAAAAIELHRAGFAAFNPTEMVLARASRVTKFKREARERAMFTSIVLAGFCEDVPWLTVLAFNHVTAFVGMGARPVPVPVANVVEVRARCGQRASTRNWAPVVGGEAEIAVGAFEGKAGEVIELSNGAAMLRLFGGGVFEGMTKPMSVPETWLRAREG